MTKRRQAASYGDEGFSLFLRRAFARHMGHSAEDWEKPVIGICNTKSEVNRCHTHFDRIVEAIKRGVLMAGGIPLEFPTISLGESFTSPTTMLYRNLAAMDTEEMIRAQPLDGVVLIGGCDKMTPAQLMGAASANIPSIMITGGPMNNGEYEGQTLGACSDCRYFWQEYRSGTVDEEELEEINKALAPTAGHCMVMGSASTMAAASEALGMMLPGGAAIPAADNRKLEEAQSAGKQIVKLVHEQLLPSYIMTEKAFENAVRMLMAIGGSTNAVIHLVAIAGRLGIELPLERFDEIGRETPFIANLRPAGKYQMQEFYYAGGARAVMKELESYFYTDQLTVTGESHVDNLKDVTLSSHYRHVIKPADAPLHEGEGIAFLRGSLAPNGAVIKPKAASEHLLVHEGRAVVFESVKDMQNKVEDPDLDVEPDDILVLKNTGPVGAPGMPEAGMLPIPAKLLKRGVRDMVRISDCRMSGTAFGTVVLHVAPESAVGGPLDLVENGDFIRLDVPARKLDLLVDDQELENRKKERQKSTCSSIRGYEKLYREHVLQADKGCDFDFLVAESLQSENNRLR
ncbi:IlvD/Edd family dehydratase [Alteribacillus sp. JSM 102045]|uniref:IlvD/Edd family dehydratase n=1 Tax=Alteribacillus sp. JSM 102045 TaxID=1562101 RepID=UPI0035BEF8B2